MRRFRRYSRFLLVIILTNIFGMQDLFASDISQLNYFAGCRILGADFQVLRTLSSSWLCYPLQDGGWIESDNHKILQRRDSYGSVLWEIKGYFHHQLNVVENKYVFALKLVGKQWKNQTMAFDEVVKVDIRNGRIVSVFSMFDHLSRDPKKFGRIDRQPLVENHHLYRELFQTNLELLHLNSVQPFGSEIVVGDRELNSFILNRNLQFKKFVDFPDAFSKSKVLSLHDLQKLNPDHFIVFKNFFDQPDTEKTTFKIYEFKKGKVTFEFPLNSKDYVEADYSGGVQKTDQGYLVAFPLGQHPSERSLIGWISLDGQWKKKSIVNFRLQDVKIIPHTDFLNRNKMK
jgi:hypothetical protein